MSHQANITRIRAVSNALGELKKQVVFVGGATVSLYADRAAVEARATDDVDIVVEIASRWEYAALEEQLRKMGFQNDISGKFLGRYLLPGIIVDVMPTDITILGFSNIWYEEGFKTAIDYNIDDQHNVKIFSPPYFIASKLEAFKNRGNNDGRTSTDFEDIIYVLENRQSIWNELKEADESVRNYLLKEFKALRNNRYIEEWIDSHSSYYSPPSTYYIIGDMENFIT
ncbi:MAG: nucleotidyl transferase AbiEii/AbiGii toxin family protein [Chitinophagaceae bacterium]